MVLQERNSLTQDFCLGSWFVNILYQHAYCSTKRCECQHLFVNVLNFYMLHKKGEIVLGFYDKYIRLCAEKGISPSAAAIEIGIRKSNVTYWKSGRNRPSDATLLKIADYFGVTVEYLKGEETKKDPAETGEVGSSDAQEILNFIRSASVEDLREVSRYIGYLKSKREPK